MAFSLAIARVPSPRARLSDRVRAGRSYRARRPRYVAPRASRGGDEGAMEDRPDVGASAVERAAWAGAEAVGRAMELTGGGTKPVIAGGARPSDRKEAIEAIREDYDENYFVSGAGKMRAYDDQCEFADPFASFRGVERFKRNVSNLGGLMRDVDLKITSFEETKDGLQTEWKFSCVLDLPWRPLLAASGGTTHTLNDDHLVVRHYERWDVEPGKVLKALLRPASKIPENQAEVFMASLTSGDVIGALGASAGVLLTVSAPIWVTSALLRAVTHTEATGLESAFGGLFVLACAGQIAKFLRGIGIS